MKAKKKNGKISIPFRNARPALRQDLKKRMAQTSLNGVKRGRAPGEKTKGGWVVWSPKGGNVEDFEG